MRKQVHEDMTNVCAEEIDPKVQHFEEDLFEPMNGTNDAGERYGVMDYIGQNQQMMRLSDNDVEKMRGMMKQVAQDVVGDDIPIYQWPQAKPGPQVPQDDQAVMPKFPQLTEELVHDRTRQVQVTV